MTHLTSWLAAKLRRGENVGFTAPEDERLAVFKDLVGCVLAITLTATGAAVDDAWAQVGTRVVSHPWVDPGGTKSVEVPGPPAADAPARVRIPVDYPIRAGEPVRDAVVAVTSAPPAATMRDPIRTAVADTQGPSVSRVDIWEGSRQLADTYVLGNEIVVTVIFDEEIRVQGGPTLALTIGAATREAVTEGGSGKGIWFRYRVQPSDLDGDGLSIAPDALRLNGGAIADLAGNDADPNLGSHAITNDPAYKVDGRRDPAPAVRSVEITSSPPIGDTYVLGDIIDVIVRFDEDVIVGARPTLTLTIGTERRQAVDEYIRPSVEPESIGMWFRYVVQDTDLDTNGISIGEDALRATVRDGTGNTANLSLGRHAIVDDPAHKVDGSSNPPAIVTRVQIDPPERGGDTYSRRDVIQVQVHFSRGVEVSGLPLLGLTIGDQTRHAEFRTTDQFGEGHVFFRYEVQATDLDDDGLSIPADAIVLNGGSIRDMSGQDVELDLGRHAVANDPTRKVDGGSEPPARIDNVVIHSRPKRGDAYGLGETISVWVLFDGEVELVPAAGSRMELALSIGAETRFASFGSCVTRGEGDFVVPCEKYTIGFSFLYDVQEDDLDEDGLSVEPTAIRLNGWRVRDRNGNEVRLDLGRHAIIDRPGHKVNGRLERAPAITSVHIFSRPQRGQTYGLDERIHVAVEFDETVKVTGEPTLALRIGTETRYAAYFRPPQDSTTAVFHYDVQATDRDPDGLSIASSALRLNGGSIRDRAGKDADSNLGIYAITNHPDHKVDGRVSHPPVVEEVSILSRPRNGDTYQIGEEIRVRVVFDEWLTWEQSPAGRLSLALTIGTETRLARVTEFLLHGGVVGFGFAYEVQRADWDSDGLSIGKEALRPDGLVFDRSGNEAELDLGSHAIGSHPRHKVDGGLVRAVGSLPALELFAGGGAAAVDVSPAFIGTISDYAATSSNPDVATVAMSGATLMVSPVGEGAATIEVTARNPNETATQAFAVSVVTDPAEVRVLKDTLAAFGRSLLSSVTMTIEGRFDAAPGHTAVAIAGRQLPFGASPGRSVGFGAAPGSVPPPTGAVADSPLAAARAAREGVGAYPGARFAGRLAADDLLHGSHFMLALGAEQPDAAEDTGLRWTVWGAGDLQSFAGEPESGTSYDGDTRAGHVGLDVGGERWLAGAVVSRTAGQADYRFSSAAATGSGRLATTLTSVQPYLRWAPHHGTSVWTILGAGGGVVENVRAHVRDRREESDLSMWLGVVGGRQTLASAGSVEFALRGDVGVLRLETGDGGEAMDGLTATVQRYRAGVETSHTTRWKNGATLKPFAVVGVRHDGGDGLTGSALELEGGVRVTGARTGLEARGRMLTMHTTGRHRERGVSVTALWTPGGTVDRGLSVAVTPRWGAANTGVDAVWREQAFGGRMMPFADDVGSVDARVGYALALRAGRVLMPFSEFGVRGDDYRWLRVGLRLTGSPHTAAPLQVELVGERSEMLSGTVNHRIGMLGALPF